MPSPSSSAAQYKSPLSAKQLPLDQGIADTFATIGEDGENVSCPLLRSPTVPTGTFDQPLRQCLRALRREHVAYPSTATGDETLPLLRWINRQCLSALRLMPAGAANKWRSSTKICVM